MMQHEKRGRGDDDDNDKTGKKNVKKKFQRNSTFTIHGFMDKLASLILTYIYRISSAK